MAISERHARAGRIGAHVSWSHTSDRAARTAPARAGFFQRFLTQVDPDGVLPEDERHRRATHAMKAHMSRLAIASARSRSKRSAA